NRRAVPMAITLRAFADSDLDALLTGRSDLRAVQMAALRGSGPAPATRPARSRARRSGRTCRASFRRAAPARSASAAPAPAARRCRAAAAQPASQLPAVINRTQPLAVEPGRPAAQLIAADANHRTPPQRR